MSIEDRPISPYKIRLALEGFEELISEGKGLEELNEYVDKSPQAEIRDVMKSRLKTHIRTEDK